MLAAFQNRFGAGFQERGQEAARCYGAHAYLDCCVMSGAAAESVLTVSVLRGVRRPNCKAALKGGPKNVYAILTGTSLARWLPE